jgi:choline dehydrogenase-like flavoprotein
MQADYVIIGAGSAGCVLANRLTEDPTIRVILVEAGGRDWNPLIHIPVGYMKLLDHKQLTWGFKVLPESATPDVQCVFAPASYKPGLIRKLDDRPGITGGPWQMRPLSRGYVLVRTPDPRDQPAINPRYLAEDTDQRAMVGGLKFRKATRRRSSCPCPARDSA